MMLRGSLIEKLREYPTIHALRASAFYQEQAASIRQILGAPEVHIASPPAAPKLRSFLRVTSWNIEKGKQFDGLLWALQEHPILRWSDLILLNEVDVGMSRSGNRHVARHLAHFLGMSYVFAPAHIELTRGVGDDLLVPGENTSALQGNAILSRHALADPRIIELPVCSEPFELAEKRYGRRVALAVELQTERAALTGVGTHLEVRNSPACRTRQMNRILESLDSGRASPSVLIAGDFNTHTFRRGGTWRTFCAFLRLACSDPARLQRRLLHPDTYNEGLFRSLARHGFTTAGFNDRQPTASAPLKDIEESAYFPDVFRRWAVDRMRRYDFRLALRLDWIAAKGLEPLSDGAVRDPATGVCSISAQTIKGLAFRGRPISDHDPIVADLRI